MVRRLLLLNGLAILCVILFHAAGWGFTAMFAWREHLELATGSAQTATGGAGYYALRTVEQFVIFCIPAFLFVSGYFVAAAAGRRQTTVGWGVVTVRVQALLRPYLVWSGILLLMNALEGRTQSPSGYLRALGTGAANPAYYYVILLVQFYLISPFLVPLARNRWRVLLITAGAIQLMVQISYYPILLGLDSAALRPFVNAVPKWFFPARIFWFSFGMVAGFHLNGLKAWAARIRWGLVAVLTVTFVAGIFEWELFVRLSSSRWLSHRETLIDTLYSAAFLLSFVAFDRVTLPFSKRLSDWGSKSFGIYLVHSPVMEYGARALYHLAPQVLVYQAITQPFLIMLGLAVPLVAMALVKRSPARALYPYLFG